MDFSLKLCVLHFIFLNLLIDTHAQDILSAILGGVQNGLNILSQDLGVGHRDYPDYGVPASRDVSWRSNDGSQLNQNQNDSEEPYNRNSESHQGSNSNSNSEECDRGNENSIHDKINNNKKDRSPNKHPGSFKGNINSEPIIRKPALDKQKPLHSEIDNLESNHSMTQNKINFNPNNVTTINNNGSTTSTPIEFLVNSSIVDKNIANLSVIEPLINQNKLNCIQPVTDTIKKDNNKTIKKDNNNKTIKKDNNDKTIKKDNNNKTVKKDNNNKTVKKDNNDKTIKKGNNNKTVKKDNNNKTIKKDNNKYVLKALTKRKFFFQAKPVTPRSEEVDANETVYYINFD